MSPKSHLKKDTKQYSSKKTRNFQNAIIFEKPSSHIRILGCQGIPASHGGFETFAEDLAQYLASQNWDVTVYCQNESDTNFRTSYWRGIRCIHVPGYFRGPLGTFIFDILSVLHACKTRQPVLTLGYNTAMLSFLYRLRKIPNIINMDGIEWKREKWNILFKIWFFINEWAGCFLANHLIADNPHIKTHLRTRVKNKIISMVPYCAPESYKVDSRLIEQMGLVPFNYCLIIARPVPENSILEIVTAFSIIKRHCKLVVVGAYAPDRYPFHQKVSLAAGTEVIFPGAIYDKDTITTLRHLCALYFHGHKVGGTNPSLVEALACSSPILAHDNCYNQWVAQDAAMYFKNGSDLESILDKLIQNRSKLDNMRLKSRHQYEMRFTPENVFPSYRDLILKCSGKPVNISPPQTALVFDSELQEETSLLHE